MKAALASPPGGSFLATTLGSDAGRASLQLQQQDTVLRFQVSRDEENVRMIVSTRGGDIDLESRAHHYVALLLGRRRLVDVEAGVVDAEQGWLYVDELARQLGTTRTHVNVALHRLRKQLIAHGFSDAFGVVERRSSSGQLRIAVRRLEVCSAGRFPSRRAGSGA